MFVRFLGIWALFAGVSLLYTFFATYRARGRYLYLLLFGIAAVLWGLETLLVRYFLPSGMIWIILGLGVVWLLMDSARRYRETSENLRLLREERLNAPLDDEPPPSDPDSV